MLVRFIYFKCHCNLVNIWHYNFLWRWDSCPCLNQRHSLNCPPFHTLLLPSHFTFKCMCKNMQHLKYFRTQCLFSSNHTLFSNLCPGTALPSKQMFSPMTFARGEIIYFIYYSRLCCGEHGLVWKIGAAFWCSNSKLWQSLIILLLASTKSSLNSYYSSII